MSEQAIQIIACLMHPHYRAAFLHTAKDNESAGSVQYGLCRRCTTKLKQFPVFKKVIDDKLCELLEKQKPVGGDNG